MIRNLAGHPLLFATLATSKHLLCLCSVKSSTSHDLILGSAMTLARDGRWYRAPVPCLRRSIGRRTSWCPAGWSKVSLSMRWVPSRAI